MTGRARAAISGALGGAGALAVAAALLTGAGASPAAEGAAVSPAAATGSATAGTEAAGTEAAGTEAATGHGSWSLEDLAARYAQLPAELRADLEALRAVPAAGRLAALEQIRDDALAGAYGEEVRAGAERLVVGLALLPSALVADLEALVSAETADVPAAVERIRDRALTGQYGERVRVAAARLVAMAQEHGVDVRGDLDRYLPGAAQAD